MKEGTKHDGDKARFDLIPPGPLYQLAEVYTFGCRKYADRNWEKGIKWGRIFAALMRHLWKWWRGEPNDEESGLPHLAHAAWGCFTLLEYLTTRPEYDDRPRGIFSDPTKVEEWNIRVLPESMIKPDDAASE